MKKLSVFLFTSLLLTTSLLTGQEALKSTEEEYYDFLSLTGVVERPTLGYRTLSDSVWNFNEVESFEENEDGSYTKVRVPGAESDGNIWKKNNLGTTYTLWEPDSKADNWFARGMKQGVTARVYGPEWFNSYNTAVPYGQNDGALWQGRGYNTALTAGLRLEGYGFEFSFKPQVSWSQNREFETNPEVYPNPYSYTFKSGTVYQPIDIVQRYGDSAFWNFDLGDTEARWTWHSFTFGFGTQNPWLGPAYLNPMLGSNNAAGYLKFDAGLRKTEVIVPFLGWSLGYIEGRLWLGQLEESDYYDNNTENDKRMLIGMSASYNPSFIPGFTFGFNRIFIRYWKNENLKYFYQLFRKENPNGTNTGNDEDQKVAIFIDFNLPKIGFEVYGELGLDDGSKHFKNNPFHTAIYTVGLKQNIPLNFTKLFPKLSNDFNFKSELLFEWNNFEMSQDFQLQWQYLGYYAHGFVRHGYTHKGQLLGAGTGYFGNSQYLEYKIYHKKGYISVDFHRYCQNNNVVYNQSVNTSADSNLKDENSIYNTWWSNYETYICYEIKSNYFINRNTCITGSISKVELWNRNYIRDNNPNSFTFTLMLDYTF